MKVLSILFTAIYVIFVTSAGAQSWIRINQLGYTPLGIKSAVWCSKSDPVPTEVYLVNTANQKTALVIKNIEVFGKSQDANGAWITTKVLTFILPKNASWNNSPFYKLDIPGEYKQIVFKIKNNWGNKSSTKIGSITLHHIPITINTKSMKLPTNISVRINGITHELTAGDYIMSADIKNKSYTFTHTQTGREIVKMTNANNLIISYDTPKDINSLLTYNKNNISFGKFTKETQEKNNVDNRHLFVCHISKHHYFHQKNSNDD